MLAISRAPLGVPSLCRDSRSAATARRRPLVYVRSFRGADEGHEEMAAAQLPAASPAPLAPPPPGRNSDLVLAAIGLGVTVIVAVAGESWFDADRIGDVRTDLSQDINKARLELSKEISSVQLSLYSL
ncbi:BANP isoform X9 [Micractinium conductrix]|uniref:BANP isoform X9 n=1 Tax=Micractinium conductrix TaxID=554055 RepID=A0A2P6V7S6_9CHLO|nr:BANP isoform X9 [Micractinium conductrix]|eukprot:PSC70133.1 BANP isoform X9 [Micractinium conductrix]